MARLFQALNTPPRCRSRALDEDLARFPHVNGDLSAEPPPIPDFDVPMRQALLDVGQFDWTATSPAIFGALFQSVIEPADRRAQGAHYTTTEKNIFKVIEPLFLDDLRGEFPAASGPTGRPRRDRPAEVPGQARNAAALRPDGRLRQLPDHRLPRASDAGDRRAAGDSFQGYSRCRDSSRVERCP